MEPGNTLEGIEVPLNAPPGQPSDPGDEQTDQLNVLPTGEDLGRLRVNLVARVEAISGQVDERGHSASELVSLMNGIHEAKLAFAKVYSDWHDAHHTTQVNTEEEARVTTAFLSVTKLINKIRTQLQAFEPEVELNPTTTIGSVSKGLLTTNTPTPLAAMVAPTQSSPEDTNIKNYGNRLSAVKSVSKRRASNCGSRRTGTSSRASTKTASKAGSRESSTGSAAAKLQLMLEEAENEAEEELHRAMTARDLRRLNRDQVRVREQNERQEQERQRDLEREKFERKRELDRRDEERRKDIERRNEQLEMERNRIADEAEDREVLMERRRAGVKAKQKAIARFEEERRNDLASEIVKGERTVSSPPSESEVSSIEKVAAYIDDLGGESTPPNQPPGGYESEVPERKSEKINTDDLISQSKALINRSKILIGEGKAMVSSYKGAVYTNTHKGRTSIIKESIAVKKGETTLISKTDALAVKQGVIISESRNAASYPKIDNTKPVDSASNENESFVLPKNDYYGGHSGPPTYTTPAAYPQYAWAPRPRQTQINFPTQIPEAPAPIVNPLVSVNKKIEHFEIHTPTTSNQELNLAIDQHRVVLPEQVETQQSPWGRDQPSYASAAYTSNADRVIDAVCSQMALSRLPAVEPEIFDGKDPLSFPIWLSAFEALVSHRAMTDVDRLSVLNRYLGGEAKKAIRGYLMLPPSEAYGAAYKLLVTRYGDNYLLAKAFRNRLTSWPKIMGSETAGLRNFIDFLNQCKSAKRSFPALRVLDDESENADLTKKLPAWLARQWGRRVVAIREATDEFPSFDNFVEFLEQEDKVAHDPFFQAIHKPEGFKERNRGGSFASETRAATSNGRDFGVCIFCRESHSLEMCWKFGAEAFEIRLKFVRDHQLCFGCLIKGHLARECRNRGICQFCRKGHPTSMHREDSLTGAHPTASITACASRRDTDRAPRKSSMIVPTYISHRDNPGREVLIYAMIDSQSDTSFITESAADALGLQGKEIHLSLSTMTAKNKVVKCTRFTGLNIRSYDSDDKITLPQLYSQKAIPVNRQHIPSADMIAGWPYLEPLRRKLIPKLDCEVGILIGYDWPRVLISREVISAGGGGPFGQRTDLGWGIVGIISKSADDDTDPIGYSHRIVVNQTTGSQITLQKRSKAIVSPADCLKVLESDFPDRICKGESSSVEERDFLRIMEEGIVVDQSDHYSMPLPFNKGKENLFNNRALVINRAMALKRKMNKDPDYKREYSEFMEEMLTKGFAEEVRDPNETLNPNVWYVPHFGVFHKTKGKLRVVFDRAARYRGVALNDTLLKGPDYLNSLVGILCRFRKHPVAFCCDVEKMFYAFHVQPSHRDYLRFLWWKGGDTTQTMSTFRMTAHLFGAVSSPACASFGLRRIPEEFPEYGRDVLRFISDDFYVDDGLKSVPDIKTAIDLVRKTVEACSRRGVRLHKFTSNSKPLLESLPESECAEKTNLLNLSLDKYPSERVLGVLWNIKDDCFEFKVRADKSPTTRREILSVTSGIFDPLGWIAPFTLKAKQVLQLLCKDKLDWDDKAPPLALREWEGWYKGTKFLQQLGIKRCVQSDDQEEQKEIQWHHFADASETAYGACSYMRMVNKAGQVAVHLVMAKSRVAPVASMTIPRLELMAAVVATRLSVILEREMGYTGIQHFFWTDSKTVLGYLNNEAKYLKFL